MDEGKISVRYAKALLSLAKEKQLAEVVKVDMDLLFHLFDTIPGFNQLLSSPVIGTKEKRQFFKNVFADSLNSITYSFLVLVLNNNREAYLRDITRNFLASYRKQAGYKEARLISATELSPEVIDQFKVLIHKHFNTEVDLTVNVDSKLIGGFVLRVEDQQIDASVAAKLKKLKRELLASEK